MGFQKDVYGSFQLYTVAPEYLTSPIPDSISFEQAIVLPLGIETSFMSFYAKALWSSSIRPSTQTPLNKSSSYGESPFTPCSKPILGICKTE